MIRLPNVRGWTCKYEEEGKANAAVGLKEVIWTSALAVCSLVWLH
jgi:hypothetical protein